MDHAELARMQAHIHSLRQRLIDTAKYLNGIAAVVEGMNRGATDGLLVAVHAVEAVAEDLSGVYAGLSCETLSIGLHNPEIAKKGLSGAPG